MTIINSLPKLLFLLSALSLGLGLALAVRSSRGVPAALRLALPGRARRWALGLGALLLGTLVGGPGLGLAALALVWGLPRWRRARARQRMFREQAEQLPAFLEALAAGLRAGLSFPQSVAAAEEDLGEPSRGLCRRLLRGLQLGDAPEQLLAREAEAWDGALATDGRLLATAVGIQREAGGDLSVQLDQLVETLRERQRLQAQVEALTAQGRLSAWVVGLLPLVLLLALQWIDPELLAPLFHSRTGWVLLALAALMEAAGVLLLRRIVDIQA